MIQARPWLLVATAATIGCHEPVQTSVSAPLEASVIFGELDWQNVTELAPGSPEYLNSRAVGYLYVPRLRQRCSAFLISSNVVMTNQHCIPTAADAFQAKLVFGYEHMASPADWDVVLCDTFLGSDAEQDFALLRCEGAPGDTYGVLELDTTPVGFWAGAYLIHHNCDYYSWPVCDPSKKYSPGLVFQYGSGFSHTCDSLRGSSGSPLFGRSRHAVLGIHRASTPEGNDGTGGVGMAVPMKTIVPILQQRFPEITLRLLESDSEPTPEPEPEEPSQPSESSTSEPNNSMSEATPVDVPLELSAVEIADASDEDWYRIENHGGTLLARIDFTHDAGDLDLFLYDGDRVLLAQSIGVTDSETIEGVYSLSTLYVRVIGYAGASGPYTLALQ